ncbi:MAG: hypothetical protein MZV70_09630 [Desulfobacterales bacterium]|nr:hypothetical protein [Desulfobacterales bacterium]
MDFAKNLARQAGRLLAEKVTRNNQIYYKGAIDLVTEADKMSEELILAEISRQYPDHGILSEESAVKNEQATLRWIIDPLDGTTNYAHGFPFFAFPLRWKKKELSCWVSFTIRPEKTCFLPSGRAAPISMERNCMFLP